MNSTRRQRIRLAVIVMISVSSPAAFVNASQVNGTPAQAMKDARQLDDSKLPSQAQRGTGIAGNFNANAMSAPQISFTLPDGRTINARRQRLSEDRAKGRKSWVGTFAEQPGSIAVMTTFKGTTTGFVSYGAETWELMPGNTGGHVMYRVDDRKLPTAEPEISYPQSTDNQDLLTGTVDAITSATTTSGGYVHDLLVVYTPAAKAAYGQTQLESMIQNAVAAANQAYQNSEVGITLNLVGLQEISYAETGTIQTSLNDLRGVSDGRMDEVHRLRDSIGADVVSLVSQDSNACGIAGVMTSVSTSFASNAFNVVKPSCLSQHSLAHEIGHNQGNKHDRASTTGSGAYPYSYGFRRCMTDGTGFRTVMAYSCSGASRVAWFSNPNADYNGHATGIAYETDAGNSADNARSMNDTAAIVAAFRTRGSATTSPAPVAPTAPAAPSGLTATGTAYNSVTARWTDNSGNETGFKLERSRNGVDYAEIATLGAGSTSYIDNGVLASSNFYYRTRTYNSAGNSAYSNVASVTTPAVSQPVPAAPAGVSARNDANGSATVLWSDASANESGFDVRREKWDSKRSAWTGLTAVGTVPANVTSLVDLSGNGTFRYSVRATNSGGASSLAGPAAVTVTGGTRKGRSGK